MPSSLSHDAPNQPALSDDERVRRAALLARAGMGAAIPADVVARAKLEDLARRAQAAADIREREELARARPRPALEHALDPGPQKARWAREGAAPEPAPAACQGPLGRGRQRPKAAAAKGRRDWKRPGTDRPLQFARDRAWSRDRSQRLATRAAKNSAIIAHPAAALAALGRLPRYSQAAVRRALRAQRWTLGDEAARRHVAWWATVEDFARPRAYSRPRQIRSSSGAVRFAGLARYSLCVVGWTQTALAIALSGAAYLGGHSDPIDAKTVQRHTELAVAHGGVQVVVRNPDAPPELRGGPCSSNSKGWPINEYWLPAENFSAKPGFVGVHYGGDGSPIGLEDALAIELTPRAKRPRRLLEQMRPPPL